MSLNCFGHLCQEAQLTTELVPDEVDVQAVLSNELPIVENMDVYLELSSAPYLIPGSLFITTYLKFFFFKKKKNYF